MAKIYRDKSGSYYGSSSYLTEKQQKFNAKCVLKYCKQLSDLGWSNNAICAILGNISAESTVNPMLNEVGGSGYGLVQWTPKSNLQKRAKAIGRYNTYSTMFTQLSVIDYEAKNNLQWLKTSDYPITFKEFIKSTESILYLTGAWLKNYERPADQSQANILKRYNGDSNGHIGSKEWNDILDFNLVDDTSITGFLKWCENIANNNKYLYKLGAGHGVPWTYDGYYFDCSSFVSFGLHNGGGYDLQTQFTTANQKTELENLGFKVQRFKSKADLIRGDILFYNNDGEGHTEVVFESNSSGATKLVGAHNDTLPPAEQISIRSYYADKWQYYARADSDNPPLPEPIPPIQFRYNQRFCPFVFPRMR